MQGLTCVSKLSDLGGWVLRAEVRCDKGFWELVQIFVWFSLGIELEKYGILENFS